METSLDVNAIAVSTEGQDLTGKTVVIRKDYFAPKYRDSDRRFKAEGGFGCSPSAIGRKVFGIFSIDGEKACVQRDDIEGIAVNAL